MRVLVVGSGGREHALVWKLKQSSHVSELFCATGNGGIDQYASCVPIKPENSLELVKFADDMNIDLTVVGPELPLSLGITDLFRQKGLRIFGPSAEAAQLESSKVFAKQFMDRHRIPTAQFRVCASYQDAKSTLDAKIFDYPVVIKADGLAAGKGVLICKNDNEALSGLEALMLEKQFGSSGERVVIEKCLVGQEVSFMVISDGERFVSLFPSCDYKRVFDNDQGPNTGGMGAYSPSTMIDRDLTMRILTEIVGPTIHGMAEEGRRFSGVLYCGLMITEEGPKVLEYNVRFGDPETQVVLPLLKNDLFELLTTAADGRMEGIKPLESLGTAVTVVAASDGYPGSYEKGKRIEGIDSANALEGVTVFHAGTKLEGSDVYTAGGRVLSVTAVTPTLEKSIFQAYNGIKEISFEGMSYRKDIAHNAIAK